ncbi:MAG: HAD family hydrolase [Eubacteriales bacterium]
MTRKAAVFDLDGTLLDTLDDISRCMNQALTRFGLDTHSPDEYKLMVGTGAYDLVRKAVLASTPNTDEETVRRILDYYTALLSDAHSKGGSIPYPGIISVLERLKALGITLCVLSNKPDEAVRSAVSRSLPGIYFARVRGQLEGVPRKPDPYALNAMLSELGLAKDKTIYFGDSGVDMQTAKNCGLYAVGVLWGYRDKAELMRDGADTLIEKAEDITGFFE